MSAVISVTEVRNALRCPRVFALGRKLGRPVAFPVGASALGATFHRIVESFAQASSTPPESLRSLAADTDDGRVAQAVRCWVLDRLVRELQSHPQLGSMPAEVDDLAEALRAFAGFVAGQLKQFGATPAAAMASLFRAAELGVEAVVELPGMPSIRLGGRVDALFEHGDGQVDVVEYKLTDEANAELDRAQVALYRYLVRKQLGVEARPTILRFDPALTVARMNGAEADELVGTRLIPLIRQMMDWSQRAELAPATGRTDLCAVCPLRSPCAKTYGDTLSARDEPPAGAVRSRPEPDGKLGPQQASATREETHADYGAADAEEEQRLHSALKEVMRSIGVPATIVGPPSIGPTLVTFQVSAGKGSVQRLDREASDLEHKLITDHGVQAKYQKRGGVRVLQVVRREARPVRLASLLGREEAFLREKPGRLVVGETASGAVLSADLGAPTCCHLLVAGMTGSGKSVLLRSMVISLAHYHGPEAIQFTLVDPKRVSFSTLKASIGAHLASPLCYECEEALGILEGLADEMEDRYRIFGEAQVQDIDDYNDLPGVGKLCRRVVVIDEFQDLVLSKALRPAFEETVQRLGAKARAAGIHLILATQRPDAKTVHPGIKANLPGKIALKVQSPVNSRIILSEGGAESLLGRGDMIADLGQGPVRAQGPIA